MKKLTFVIISGAPRSGTSFFAATLSSHLNVAILHERSFADIINALGIIFSNNSMNEIIDALLFRISATEAAPYPIITDDGSSVDRSVRTALSSSELIVRDFFLSRDKAFPAVDENIRRPNIAQASSVLASIFEAIYEKENLTVIGTKIPNFHVHTECARLAEIGLTYKEIYISRNPVDIINSSIHRRNLTNSGLDNWAIASVDQAVQEWYCNWVYADLQMCADNVNFLNVSYDRLLSSPNNELEKVSIFLGIDNRFDVTSWPLPPELCLYALTREELDRVEFLFGRRANEIGQYISAISPNDLFLTAPLDGAINACVDPGLYFVSGFGGQDSDGRWTIGKSSRIKFRVSNAPPTSNVFVKIQFMSLWRREEGFHVFFKVCGCWQSPILLGDSDKTEYIKSYISEVKNGEVSIDILIPRPKCAEDMPVNDIRPLGIYLKQVTYELIDVI
ncbi:hypothetical+protein [Methylocapsa aurea]|uniref:sulfotransferase n=1 Tax=Methylocapsa aurea TaxID=663610 RepID=UPI003D18F7BF